MIVNIDNAFVYHAPKAGQVEMYQELRNEGKVLARLIADLCPRSDEKWIAVKKVREAIMWANSSIACYGEAQSDFQSSEVKRARNVLIEAFKNDLDFRNTYVANIAMTIFDMFPEECKEVNGQDKHSFCNQAAELVLGKILI